VLEGDSLLSNKDAKAAVDAYEKAFAKTKSTATILRLTGALRAADRSDEAESRLKEWIDQHPKDASASLTLGTILQQSKRDKDATTVYEQVLNLQPENIVALNNLAWLYFEGGDKRALDYAQRAYQRFPERAEIVDTYGWVLLHQGQLEKGLQMLEKATKKAPANGDIRYHYAAALAKVGEKAHARTELKALLDSKTPFTERQTAKDLLSTL